MAFVTRLITELIGAAFEAIERKHLNSSERARAAWRWLLQVAEAPPDLELVASDGSTYSGFVFFDRSRVVLLFALRHPPHTRPPRPERMDWPAPACQSSLASDESVQDTRNALYRS